MKRFITTKLFGALLSASQKGTVIDAKELENRYDEFAGLLFSENAVSNRAAYRNALVYTRIELAGLTGVPGKKCGNLSSQSH